MGFIWLHEYGWRLAIEAAGGCERKIPRSGVRHCMGVYFGWHAATRVQLHQPGLSLHANFKHPALVWTEPSARWLKVPHLDCTSDYARLR